MTTSQSLIFKEVKEKLKDQFESIDTIDNKAGIILAVVAAIIAGLINSIWFIALAWYFLSIILILFILATLAALMVILVRDYKKDPDPSALIENYQNKTEEETVGQLIRNFSSCFYENEKSIKRKKVYLNISFVCIFLSIFILSVAIFFTNNTIKIESNMKKEVIKYAR